MEVLVLAVNSGADTMFDVVLGVLESSAPPIEIFSSLPSPPVELQDHQVLVSRKRLDRDSLSAFIKKDQAGNADTLPTGPFSAGDTSHLLRKIGRKSKKIKLLSEQVDSVKAKAQDAIQKAQHLEMEQEQFFDDVQEMKNQFDKLAENHRKLMWEYLPARDPSLRAIPRLTAQLPETPTTIGQYPLEQVLGYGQYAVVYTSSTPERAELAIKAIDKQKLVDLVSLHRISSEITSLSDTAIRHPGILELVDVIHTHKHVYLVTERGGKDLFEFFGAHVDGLGEDTIRPLFLNLAQAVEVLHRNNYCHRDLKPENVLYAPESSHLVKLIDFGLCTKATTELHDFCGSPGFFAPELLLHDGYDGCKADVWSIGCILLELVLGNTLFSSIWMSMYDISILKEPKTFGECVKAALTQMRDFCNGSEWRYSAKLRSALVGMLCENPTERLSIHQVLAHPWLTVEGPLPASHSVSRRASPVKTKRSHGLPASAAARISDGDASIQPLPRSLDYPPLVSSAPGSPRVHHLHSPPSAKLNLPSLSPDKPPSRCSPERKASTKLAFSVTRV
ncbi:CAMK/CAMKL/SNRK protein kinase [Phytophthora nicotianae P1976]|uniref:CAMK/CAMKL/SNRK protein kinase n=1 Tax=Phytophthora nicotianae P1976 TaxID=1317066 RepID=A0A081B0K2_PHYNI|nr:CAMK/CAMKL/SNRK protein kinase [Phytophthora nicotianae P1976]